jgi:hypothetical protein
MVNLIYDFSAYRIFPGDAHEHSLSRRMEAMHAYQPAI